MYLTNQCITYSLELQNEKAEKYCGFQPCTFKENELKPKSVIDLFKQKENKGSPQIHSTNFVLPGNCTIAKMGEMGADLVLKS